MHIAQLEFVYNNTLNDSTGQTPFYVASGQHSPTLYDALRQAPSVQDAEVNTAAKYFVSEPQRAMDAARKVLMDTNITLTKRLNKSRRHIVYDIGDEVMLSTINLKLPIGSSRAKKFTSRFIGPFTVTNIVANGLASTLKLPPRIGLHTTFHVGLLKPYLRDSRLNRDAPSPQPDIFEDGHEEWEVEAIVDHRPASRGREPSYLVKWVGFLSHENSWLPARQLSNAKDLLAAYQSRIVAGQPARARRGRHAN
jgi:Chromo (CHRromatin Organisation MOdifier) domain